MRQKATWGSPSTGKEEKDYGVKVRQERMAHFVPCMRDDWEDLLSRGQLVRDEDLGVGSAVAEPIQFSLMLFLTGLRCVQPSVCPPKKPLQAAAGLHRAADGRTELPPVPVVEASANHDPQHSSRLRSRAMDIRPFGRWEGQLFPAAGEVVRTCHRGRGGNISCFLTPALSGAEGDPSRRNEHSQREHRRAYGRHLRTSGFGDSAEGSGDTATLVTGEQSEEFQSLAPGAWSRRTRNDDARAGSVPARAEAFRTWPGASSSFDLTAQPEAAGARCRDYGKGGNDQPEGETMPRRIDGIQSLCHVLALRRP